MKSKSEVYRIQQRGRRNFRKILKEVLNIWRKINPNSDTSHKNSGENNSVERRGKC